MWPARAGTGLTSRFRLLVLPRPLVPWFWRLYVRQVFQVVGWSGVAHGEGFKCLVFDCLGGCAEEGGGFYVPHGYREVESDELLLIGVSFGTRNTTDGMSSSRTQMRI